MNHKKGITEIVDNMTVMTYNQPYNEEDNFNSAWIAYTTNVNNEYNDIIDFIKTNENKLVDLIEIKDIYVPMSQRKKGLGSYMITKMLNKIKNPAVIIVSAGFTEYEILTEYEYESGGAIRYFKKIRKFYEHNNFTRFPWIDDKYSMGFIYGNRKYIRKNISKYSKILNVCYS